MKPQVSTEVTQSVCFLKLSAVVFMTSPIQPLNIEDPDPPVIATTPAPEPPHTPSPVAEAPSPVCYNEIFKTRHWLTISRLPHLHLHPRQFHLLFSPNFVNSPHL